MPKRLSVLIRTIRPVSGLRSLSSRTPSIARASNSSAKQSRAISTAASQPNRNAAPVLRNRKLYALRRDIETVAQAWAMLPVSDKHSRNDRWLRGVQ